MEHVNVHGVQVLRWNPRTPLPLRPRRLFRWTRHLPIAPRVRNAGDVLGPEVVRQLHHARPGHRVRKPETRLAAVGSVIHMLPPSTVVWGPGVNGKHLDLPLPPGLDVRAVRGPLTGRYLTDRGITHPGVYGDPALLLRTDITSTPRFGRVVHVPNLNDLAGNHPPWLETVDPRTPLSKFLTELSTAELVIGSSLHAVILAERLGVPARAIRSGAEPTFKYEDYYEGTGRAAVRIARSAPEALELGGVDAAPTLDPALAATFPYDLWNSERRPAR